MPATVVFVHGGWSGSWTWQEVVKELDGRGVASVAVDLPSCSAADPAVDFRDDARHVRSVIDDVGGPVVLVGNSYGGLPMTEGAAGHPSVKRLVYLAAQMPAVGQRDMGGALAPELASAIRLRDDGLLEVVDVEAGLKVVMQQAPEHAKDLFRTNIAGKAMSIGTDPTATMSAAAWETIPSTYVVCSEDRAIPPELQREVAKARATEVIEWPSDHAPQHSHPRDVTDLLEKLANEAG